MNISEGSLESEIDNLVDELVSERESEKKKLKFFTDGLFNSDGLDTDFDVKFNTGEAVKREEPEIIYI